METKRADIGDLKHKLRRLRRIERRIRFGGGGGTGVPLIWDRFFSLSGADGERAKYTLGALAAMSREEFKNAIEEFFVSVYFELYRIDRTAPAKVYNPELLARLGVSPEAGEREIKKRFRELAKEYHPDTGGDPDDFIWLMEVYEKLLKR